MKKAIALQPRLLKKQLFECNYLVYLLMYNGKKMKGRAQKSIQKIHIVLQKYLKTDDMK